MILAHANNICISWNLIDCETKLSPKIRRFVEKNEGFSRINASPESIIVPKRTTITFYFCQICVSHKKVVLLLRLKNNLQKLMDIGSWMTGPWQWTILFIAALFVGMSKTGIQGLTILTVPLLAMTFGAKPSTGLMLPILCFADLIAVGYYRRKAEWKYILRLLPAAIAGFFLAIFVDHLIPPTEFKHLMGACLALVLVVMIWSQRKGKENIFIDTWWYGPLFGLLGGFTTMIGNAAGPVMAIYLLSTRMPKLAFVGTNAWFFLTVNYLKIPLQVFAWNNISMTTLAIDACAIPFVLIGGYIGIKLVKFLPEREFRIFTTIVTCISVAVMLLS